MRLKERGSSPFAVYIKSFVARFFKILSNKKTKIIYGIVKIIFVLFIGFFLGLLFTKFFGTFDNPSRAALDLVNLGGLRDEKYILDGVKNENFKIPLNWIKGQFSNPEKIYIDINFKNYQKLEFKRQQALDLGTLLTSAEDYVPATITHKNKKYDIKLRLKGDHVDHISTDKWSFRIKIKGDESLFGMKTFSIQHPKTRIYSNELLYNLILAEEGVLALRYDFIEVVINGENKGIYALEEHFSKELAESNNRREGIFLKFSEDFIWQEYAGRPSLSFDFDQIFQTGIIETFDNDEFLEDPLKQEQFVKAQNLLEAFRIKKLKTHEVFDSEKLAGYFAITVLLNADHAAGPQNIRFYYNPVTSLLEPIGFDGYVNPSNSQATILNYMPSCIILEDTSQTCTPKRETFIETIFSDEVFFKKYVEKLEEISSEDYLLHVFEEINPILNRAISVLYKDYPYAYVPKEAIYNNQLQINEMLHPVQGLNVFFQKDKSTDNKLIFSVGNINSFPLEILNMKVNGANFTPNYKLILQPYKANQEVNYENLEIYVPFKLSEINTNTLKLEYKILGANKIKTSEVTPWSNFDANFTDKDFIRKNPNYNSFKMLDVNEKEKFIFIKPGKWQINNSLIIPPGYAVFSSGDTEIDLVNQSMILSYSKIKFKGDPGHLIKIHSSDGTGQGLSVFSSKDSLLENVWFDNLTYPKKDGWELTGSVTFYDASVRINNVFFSNISAEDSLNLISSDFSIDKTSFKNCSSDCIDDDFSDGVINNSDFENCMGDCIDLSGAFVNITSVHIDGAKDKGISIGEKSFVRLSFSELNNTFIGLASKDDSQTSCQNLNISNSIYGLAVYEKKSEYGPAAMNCKNTLFFNVQNNHILDKNSNLKINGTIFLGNKDNIYQDIYGGNL